MRDDFTHSAADWNRPPLPPPYPNNAYDFQPLQLNAFRFAGGILWTVIFLSQLPILWRLMRDIPHSDFLFITQLGYLITLICGLHPRGKANCLAAALTLPLYFLSDLTWFYPGGCCIYGYLRYHTWILPLLFGAISLNVLCKCIVGCSSAPAEFACFCRWWHEPAEAGETPALPRRP